MDFERKNENNRKKNESPNDDFFDCIFEWILRGFGEGFGKLLGESWEALEALGSFFDVIFDQVTTHLKLRISSIEKKRSQERIWRGLGTILDGFWERPRCISGWKSVPLKLLFYGTDS